MREAGDSRVARSGPERPEDVHGGTFEGRWNMRLTRFALPGLAAAAALGGPAATAATQTTIVSLVGDKDGFGMDHFPEDGVYSSVFDAVWEADDPVPTDRVLVLSAYTGDWPAPYDPLDADGEPLALRGPQPFTHVFDTLDADDVISATLVLHVADIDDSHPTYDAQLFLDDEEVDGAFDTGTQFYSGLGGYSHELTFELDEDVFELLEDGELEVLIDDPGRAPITSWGISDGILIDYSELTIVVADSTPPTLAPEASRTTLWPPNHKMVEVTIEANASDAAGDVTLSVAVSDDEDDDEDDWDVVEIDGDTITLDLRAERDGRGDGRTYTITVTATDEAGNSASEDVTVTVSHDRRR